MLWEDVFCQSKRSVTGCREQEDLVLSQKKVQSAADMLWVAFIEFYWACSLNMAAFAKILQKYDKVTCLFVAQSYLHRLKCAYVNSSEKVNELMEKVEVTIFTEHFTSGNLQKAIGTCSRQPLRV